MKKIETGAWFDVKLNEFKHILDFGPVAARRKQRAIYQIEQTGLLNYLTAGQKLLDIGCGKGYIGGEIKSRVDEIRVFDIDLLDRPTNRMRRIISQTFCTADACSMPFPDGIFDRTIVFFVMHHMESELQEYLLRESMRVTKKNNGIIFVAEDTISAGDINQLRVTIAADYRLNPDFGLNKPHTFRSKEEWMEIFSELDLKTIDIVDYHTGKVPHTFFALAN